VVSAPSLSSIFTIGHINNTHGLKGLLKLTLLKVSYKSVFKNIKTCYLNEIKYQVEKSSTTPKGMLIKLVGINTVEEAVPFKNFTFAVDSELIDTLADKFLTERWIGYAVYDSDKKPLGYVDNIIYTGANDVLLITCEEEELLVPVTDEYVLAENNSEKYITILKPEYA